MLENLNLGDIIEDLTIADANGENAIEVIVAREQTTTLIDQDTGDVISQETLSGNDIRAEDSIEDAVSDLTDAANPVDDTFNVQDD